LTDVVYNRIALLRAERAVSRREFADALGVHYQTIGYLERGEYNPSLHLALRIAAFFDLPAEVIFSLEPFPRITAAYADRPAGKDDSPPAPGVPAPGAGAR
jgi:putative transcriptional regulator